MVQQTSRTRYLLTCRTEDELNELDSFLQRLLYYGKRPAPPPLISSTEVKRGTPAGVGIVNKDVRVISVALTPQQLKKVKESHLCSTEKDFLAFTCVARVTSTEAAVREYPFPWGIKKIDADIVWSKTKGKGVKVAVLDTGIEANHRNLKKNTKKGVSFVENVSSPNDDNGHGTHCAGIIAATVGNNEGVYGVAPEATLYPVKVLNYNGYGPASVIITGLEWCLNNKIDIVSMSFRFPSDSPPGPALKQACKTLWDRGVLLVAAVGNEWEDKRSKRLGVGYPARYDCVIGVGATDSLDTIAPFSNRGKGVDLVAPGVDILSTYRAKRYRKISGTSQACPHVAGVAALLKSYRRSLNNEDIKKVLFETADPLGSPEIDEVYGNGLVNATGAIEQVDVII